MMAKRSTIVSGRVRFAQIGGVPMIASSQRVSLLPGG
jgi:hypothetical protein